VNSVQSCKIEKPAGETGLITHDCNAKPGLGQPCDSIKTAGDWYQFRLGLNVLIRVLIDHTIAIYRNKTFHCHALLKKRNIGYVEEQPREPHQQAQAVFPDRRITIHDENLIEKRIDVIAQIRKFLEYHVILALLKKRLNFDLRRGHPLPQVLFSRL